MAHQVTLEDSELIFFSEALVLLYTTSLMQENKALKALDTTLFLFAKLLRDGYTENLRSLLREPLRDREFRKKFYTHFETHPHLLFRQAANTWLNEILVWDE